MSSFIIINYIYKLTEMIWENPFQTYVGMPLEGNWNDRNRYNYGRENIVVLSIKVVSPGSESNAAYSGESFLRYVSHSKFSFKRKIVALKRYRLCKTGKR